MSIPDPRGDTETEVLADTLRNDAIAMTAPEEAPLVTGHLHEAAAVLENLEAESILLRHDNARLKRLVGLLAKATFEQGNEGGGHDLGLWLDSEEITEDEYKIIKEALREHPGR